MATEWIETVKRDSNGVWYIKSRKEDVDWHTLNNKDCILAAENMYQVFEENALARYLAKVSMKKMCIRSGDSVLAAKQDSGLVKFEHIHGGVAPRTFTSEAATEIVKRLRQGCPDLELEIIEEDALQSKTEEKPADELPVNQKS